MNKTYFGFPVRRESRGKNYKDGDRNKIWALECWLAPVKMECNLGFESMNDCQVSYLQGTMEDILKDIFKDF